MNQMFKFPIVALMLAASCPAQAQISHGGEPWTSGTRPIPVTMPSIDRAALNAQDAVTDKHKDVPWRFGVEHEVNLNAVEHGMWVMEQGYRVWRLVLEAPGATSISVRFNRFDVPKSGSLFLYNSDGSEFIGALDHRNMKAWGGLATGLLATDHMIVEYRQPIDLNEMPVLEIDQVVQGYRALGGWPHGEDRGPFGNSGACNINVNCPEGAIWATEKRSVALIVNGGFAACTGALVNNTLNDGTPYFLTANHCLGNPGSWVYYFNHEAATCTGNSGPTNQSISGGTLLANSGQSDFALIELSEVPPASFNVQYAGWDASGDVPESAVGIHHPSGDVKKICFEDDSPYQTTGNNAQVWWIDQWEDGVTEPGSSGSPLFDQNHRIIGQLFGGSAACSGSVNNGQPDFYGRFNVSWDLGLDEYLDPAGLGVQVWDGFPDGAVSFDNDAGIAISGSPEGVLCGAQEVIIEVTLTNTGTSTLTSCMLTYQINGGAPQQQSWAGTLEQYETTVVELPAFQSQGGVNTVQVNVTTPNGVADENALNNTTSVEFTSYEGPTYNFTLTLVLDNYGSETTWTLKRLGQTLYSGGPYQDGTNGQTLALPFCLEEGCYQFRIADSYDDGICCDFGEGSWTITDPNGEVVGTGGEFGTSQQIQFCADESLGTTAIHESGLHAFPVPTNGELTLIWPEAHGHAWVKDLSGRVQKNWPVNAHQSNVSTLSWAQGAYVVVWIGNNGRRETTRISVVN